MILDNISHEKTSWQGSFCNVHSHCVFQAIIVSRILYDLPAWGRLLSKELSGRIDAFLKRCYRYGFASESEHVDVLLDRVCVDLFQKIRCSQLRLHDILPPILRHRAHSFVLPQCNSNLYKNLLLIVVCSKMCNHWYVHHWCMQVCCVYFNKLNWIELFVREKKELKAKQAKHSMESVKSVMSDKSVKNKAERDRSVFSETVLCWHLILFDW